MDVRYETTSPQPTSAGALLLITGACAAPAYDEQTDRMISALQADVDTQLLTLISMDQELAALSTRPVPVSAQTAAELRRRLSYAANLDFYGHASGSRVLGSESMLSQMHPQFT
jgi:hypothetical protein